MFIDPSSVKQVRCTTAHFVLWLCCLGLFHESQNESILAERAFLEARRQLRAKDAEKQAQRKEEGEEREADKEEEEGMAMPAYQSHTVEQGEMQREQQQ